MLSLEPVPSLSGYMRPPECPLPSDCLRSCLGLFPKSQDRLGYMESSSWRGVCVWMGYGHLQGPLSCRVKLRIENGKLDQRPAFVLPRPQMFKVACEGTSPEVPKEGATTSSLPSVFHWRILHVLHKEASVYGWKREGSGNKPLMQLRVSEHGVT